MRKVVLLQSRLMHYRVELFERLREACASRNIDFRLVHGQATEREESKRDVGFLPWADMVSNHYLAIGGRDVMWQPFPKQHKDAELVIFMQENRLLNNYYWLFFRGVHRAKVAYWGHGRNFQTERPTGLLEKWKQFLIGQVDWWFAYTQATCDILQNDGYPAERITLLNNAIDNVGFSADLASISDGKLSQLRSELGLNVGAPVGLFCGSLYPDKRLDYLLQAADKIRQRVSDFNLVVIGDGPSAGEIKVALNSRPWLHWVGMRKGVDKAAYFRLADVILNPGAVGLHVLDSFCAGAPMITTTESKHGPEIAYLENGKNGLIVSGDADVYANAVIDVLTDPSRHQALKNGALAGAQIYTLPNMVEHFVDGMERCLAMPKKF